MRPLHLPLLATTALILIASCQAPPPAPQPSLDDFAVELAPGELGLAKLPSYQAPDFSVGWQQREQLAISILNSLSYLSAPSSQQYFPYGPISHERMVASLERFLDLLETSISAEDFGQSIHSEFEVWSSRGRNNTGEVLFTGYCRPILNGSKQRSGKYKWPLYRLPKDLLKTKDGRILGRINQAGKVVPYWSHRELVEGNMLDGQEFVWLDDPFDAYIAQVQGSALIELRDGSFLEAGYAGKNGHDYKSVGQILIKEGRISKVDLSLTRLQQYFREHPEEVRRVLPQNPSFVFFQSSEGGPFGCLGRPVTPMRSVATDKDVFPRAGLVFCEVRLPDYDQDGMLVQRPTRFFALDQDRGGAIRSPGRCDVFLGTGPEAMARAGHVLAIGRMYYLVLREAVALTSLSN